MIWRFSAASLNLNAFVVGHFFTSLFESDTYLNPASTAAPKCELNTF